MGAAKSQTSGAPNAPNAPNTARVRLRADDWAAAALTAIGEGGVAAVAIEPLAVRLGTTKGSFYWHFTNRDALLAAALGRWQQERTEAVIVAMDAELDAAARLRRLFSLAVGAAVRDRAELALLATADHPLVGPVLQAVTQRRVGYLSRIFVELGLEADEARAQALLAYSAYLGYLQLAHATPELLPSTRQERERYVDRVIEALLPDR